MPTVHCPSCRRALNQPDTLRVEVVRCPLCQTEFTPPNETVLLPVPLVSGAAADSRPVPRMPRPTSNDPEPFDFMGDQEDPLGLPRQEREALRTAAWWLQGHAILGIGQTLACGCLDLMVFAQLFSWLKQKAGPWPTAHLYVLPLTLFLLQLTGLIAVCVGAEEMKRRRKRWLGLTACVLAISLSCYKLLLASLLLVFLWEAEASIAFCVLALGMAGLTASFGLIGGVSGWRVLNKPEVAQSFVPG